VSETDRIPDANPRAVDAQPDVTLEQEGRQEDAELRAIVSEEERCLARVVAHVQQKPTTAVARRVIDYDRQLLDLRDQIAQARLEDVPPLLEQMERLQNLAARQGQSSVGHVDAKSPYFGRMVLSEAGRNREILIGRSTYVDTSASVRIVDWRDAPVSRLYYRYDEGDSYEETFGEREVEGEILIRRSLTIVEARLRRVVSPQGVFVHPSNGEWKRGGVGLKLQGGQGMAARPEHLRRGKLGIGSDEGTDDRHLKAITALIDPRQFELITKPDSGLVVIQGGAGSGKTTIGLHRLAYLAFQDRRRFRPDRMLVIAFNQALVRYISQVLPALEVTGVGVRTYTEWASRLTATHFPELTRKHAEDTPALVTRLKKHPAMLKAIEDHVERIAGGLEARFEQVLADAPELLAQVRQRFRSQPGRPLSHRLHALSNWLEQGPAQGPGRGPLARELRRGLAVSQDVVSAWSELITDLPELTRAMQRHAPGQFASAELAQAHAWCTAQSALVILELDRTREAAERREEARAGAAARRADPDARGDRPRARAAGHESDRETVERERPVDRDSVERDATEREAIGRDLGERRSSSSDGDTSDREPADSGMLDGMAEADSPPEALLDLEDDTLLLRLHQRLRGPLLRPGGQDALSYEHILVDEAQDLSPVELAVLIQTVSGGQSITLAGDVAQRLHMENGFTGWQDLLEELSLSHVQVEPLRISYRSTEQIVQFAESVLGPLASGPTPKATRAGVPVELFSFAHTGDAVGFLAEALRELCMEEPQASVAVIARYPEQADLFYVGLHQAEIPSLRRIAEQDFPFKAGVDVTDLRQVKGLEFDYVVLVEVNQSTYPEDDESRHLLHIGATRAAHQLWLLCAGKPSELLPRELRDREF
jgi:DNA helicase-2/ATP-dependent DNA helicase PcrA